MAILLTIKVWIYALYLTHHNVDDDLLRSLRPRHLLYTNPISLRNYVIAKTDSDLPRSLHSLRTAKKAPLAKTVRNYSRSI
jgi:hypothetical protein